MVFILFYFAISVFLPSGSSNTDSNPENGGQGEGTSKQHA